LGMLGYVLAKYGGGTSTATFLSMLRIQLTMLYDQFFNIYLILTTVFCLLHFLNKKRNMKLAGLVFWFFSIFFINVYFKQGSELDTFRYAHYAVPLLLVMGFASIYIFEYVRNLKASFVFKKYLAILAILFLAGIFFYNGATVLGTVLNRKTYSNPLKAVSFYARERGNEDSTIFQLIPPRTKRNFWGEYYFGKCYMEPGGKTERQLFCFGEHSINEYKKAYNLKDFDFYVEYHDETYNAETRTKIKEFLNSASKRGLKKVADIARDGKIFATIYSPHAFSYEMIDANIADKLWDKKYANLENLLQSRWCGLSILWGYHHRLD